MSRRQWIQSHRPSAWFLLPTVLGYVLFVQAHKDVVWSALCSTAIVSSYFTTFSLSWPKRRADWVRWIIWAVITWFVASTYYDAVMSEGAGLHYYPRFVFKPWIVTPSGMWAGLWLACVWHVSFKEEDHSTPLLLLNGWVVLCSGQFLNLSATYRAILVAYCLVLAVTLFVTAYGHRTQGSRKLPKLRHWVSFSAWSLVIGFAVWGVILGLHQAESRLPQFIMQFMRHRFYSGHIGSRDSMMIRRRQNIRLSTTLVATIRGAKRPGYLRTQVMTRYKQGMWSSPRFEWPLPSVLRKNKAITYRLPGASRKEKSPLAYVVHAFKHLDNSMLLSYGSTHLQLGPKTRCMFRMGHSLSCEPNRLLEEYRFRRRTMDKLPFGTGLAELPGTAQLSMEREKTYQSSEKRKPGTKKRAFLDAIAFQAILSKLRPLALKVAGTQKDKPLQAAQRIQDYFHRHYTYSLHVRLSKKGDPTVDFVLNRRPAFCEYFASGMALMMMSLGHKARIASGFAVKEFNNYSQAWLVRQRDAHAWTEVYDAANKRWVAYDATAPSMDGWPAFRKSTSSWRDFWAGLQVRWQEFVAWVRKGNMREWLTSQVSKLINAVWHWSTMVFLILVWLLMEGWRQRRALLRWMSQFAAFSWLDKEPEPEPGAPSQEEARRLLSQLLEMWSERGWSLGKHETLEDFLARLKEPSALEEPAPPVAILQSILPLYNALRFQPVASTPKQPDIIQDPKLRNIAALLREEVSKHKATWEEENTEG